MTARLILLFILYHQISAWEFLYKEIEYLNGSCFPRDSCAQSRNEEDDHLWNKNVCECGTHCIQYRTCCADSPHTGKILERKSESTTCQKLTTISDAVIAVSQCSNRWRYGLEIRNKCEKTNGEKGDPIATVPVTNLVTHITYKNYFCAICNFDAQNLFMWNIVLQFGAKESIPSLSNITDDYVLKNIIYDDNLKSWGIMDADTFYDMKIQYKLPKSLQKIVKKCYQSMVTQCNPLCKYSYELEHKCESYYSPIRLKTESHFKKFRNIHCALCNNINLTQSDVNICKLDSGVKKAKPPFSFALLLDVNRNDGDLVGITTVCGDKETWDPFSKKCRSLMCVLPGYVLKDGKCVKN